MKMNARGFTLVELMIVIAIIGILAAALFPMMSGYMARSRDTARVSHINQIATALSSYYADKSEYPPSNGACVPSTSTGELISYMSNVPKDPTTGHANAGCPGYYGYNTGSSDAAGTPAFYLAANMENGNGGNTGVLASQLTLDATLFAAIQTYTKGFSGGYIIAR